jgi:hypothetical protein
MRVPSPRSRRLLARAARGVWTLPTNLVGHLAGLLVTRSRPRPVGGETGRAWLYVLPAGSRFEGAGAIALGHAIVGSRAILEGEAGRLVLAHELSHTRQHDWLGPLYLPLHGLAQLASVAIFLVRPRRDCTPHHSYNPLEQRFLCVGYGALQAELRSRAAGGPFLDETTRVLAAFGV